MGLTARRIADLLIVAGAVLLAAGTAGFLLTYPPVGFGLLIAGGAGLAAYGLFAVDVK